MADSPNPHPAGIASAPDTGGAARTRVVLYCCADLLWSTRVKGTGEAAGVVCRPVRNAEMLAARLGDCDVAGVLIDLEAGEVCFELLAILRQGAEASRKIPVIAFAPHVHVELMQRAASSGASAVLARGAFAANMARILTELSSGGRVPITQMND